MHLSQRRKESSKTRSEQFINPHKAASGFPIDPPRPSRVINEPIKNHSDHFPPIISHSGPLAPGIEWAKSLKRYDDISIGSSRADLSILSRPVLPGDSQDRCVASQLDSSNQIEMPVELLEAAVRRQDQRHYVQKFGASRHGGNGRSNAKEAAQVSFPLVSSLFHLRIRGITRNFQPENFPVFENGKQKTCLLA